jgi:hypothetical protein
MEQSEKLKKVLADYAVPDPKIVSKLPKGGVSLDFIGHADVTRILISVDPLWNIEPVAVDEAGLPARVKIGNMIQAGFRMTLLGHTRYCVGSVEDRKSDVGKELISDAIRNGAMRFGIALSLWTKAEWNDLDNNPKPAIKAVTETKVVKPVSSDTILNFIAACDKEGIDHDQVADMAGVDITGTVTTEDLSKLRAAFKTMKGNK